MRRCGLLMATLLVCALPAAAQTSQPVEFLTAVPDAPAFTFLSVNPGQVQRPGTLRDLGAALLSGVGPDGRAQQGFALDASVWTLVPGLSIDLPSYQRSRLAYMLANTQLSLASVRSAADSADTDVAIGAHVTVLDRSDPMRDPVFTQQLGAAGLACLPRDSPNADPAVVQACVDTATANAFTRYTKQNWNRPRLSIAAAAGTRFVGSRTSARRYSGLDVWAVGSLPVTARGELIGQARFTQRPLQDTVPAFTSIDLGARLVFGTGTFNVFGEVVTESRSYDEIPDAPDRRSPSTWSGGVELRVGENMWMSTGFGSRYNGLGEPDETLVFGHIRWAVTSSARMNNLIPAPGGAP